MDTANQPSSDRITSLPPITPRRGCSAAIRIAVQLADGRPVSMRTISAASGYAISTIANEVLAMEKRGEIIITRTIDVEGRSLTHRYAFGAKGAAHHRRQRA